jgi:hypothetical protein
MSGINPIGKLVRTDLAGRGACVDDRTRRHGHVDT